MIVETSARKMHASPSAAQPLPMFATIALLDKFMPQAKAGNELAQQVTENQAIKAMENAFERALATHYSTSNTIYDEIMRSAPYLHCTPADIELFSVASLPRFEKITGFWPIAGLFLSAVINTRQESDFAINLCSLGLPVDYIGYKNTKNVVVNSDVGGDVGSFMEKGTLTIFGNAGAWLGEEMKGGTIILNGNAEVVGGDMTGGEIIVNGNIQSTAAILGGRVVVNGRITAFAGHNIGEVWQNGVQISAPTKILRRPQNK